MLIGFLVGAAVTAVIILFNLAFLLYYWNREDRKKDKHESKP